MADELLTCTNINFMAESEIKSINPAELRILKGYFGHNNINLSVIH